MSWLALAWTEIRRLAHSRLAGVCLAAVAGLCVLGTQAVEHSGSRVYADMRPSSLTTAAGYARYGAMGGSLLFGLLTLLVLSQDERKRSRELIEAGRDYGEVVLARVAALLVWAFLAVAPPLLLSAPAQWLLGAEIYEPQPYLFACATILLPSLLVAVLLGSGFYLLFASLDVAFLAFIMTYLAGFSSSHYLLTWVTTPVTMFSDFAGLEPVGRFIIYNRLCWAALALTIFLAAWIGRSRAGCSRIESLNRNLRSGYAPTLLAVSATCAFLLYRGEPYLAPMELRSPPPTANDRAQLNALACQTALYPNRCELEGEVHYDFEKGPETIRLVFQMNPGLKVRSLTINGDSASWIRAAGTGEFSLRLPAGERAQVTLTYAGRIRVGSAGGFAGYIGNRSVYLLEAALWLPRPLCRLAETVTITGSVNAPSALTVVTPGVLLSTRDRNDRRNWQYRADSPNLDLGLFAAEYRVERFQAGDIPVELYISPRHANASGKLGVQDYLKDILDYYQVTLGPYPFDWPVRVVETSLYKPGGHSSLNVVTLAEYHINRRPLDSPTLEMRFFAHDLKMMAHELAHQWWGSNVRVSTEGEWSSEGLAEFCACQYAAVRLGAGVARPIVQGWEAAYGQHRNVYFVKDPAILQRMRPRLAAQLQQSLNLRRAYSVMPLRLHRAEQRLGPEVFSNRLARVYSTFRGHSLSYRDFTNAMGLTGEVMALE